MSMLRRVALAALLASGTAAAVTLRAMADDFPVDGNALTRAMLFAFGLFTAAVPAQWFVDCFVRHNLMARMLLVGTLTAALALAILGTIFGLHHYVSVFADNDPVWTRVGFLQFAFTAAQGAFYFGVFGLRLLWPWGLAALIAFAVIAGLRPAGAPATPKPTTRRSS
jgi:hypothetical protein